MTRRPMCLLCLLLIAAMCLLQGLGVPLIKGNPLPKTMQAWILKNPQAVIRGEVEQLADTEHSQSVYLKGAVLLHQSYEFPIQKVRIFLKEKPPIRMGAVLLVSGKLEEVPRPRNPGEFDSRQYYACQHIYYQMKNGVVKRQSGQGDWLLEGLENLRRIFGETLDKAAGEQAGVFKAMLLGDKSQLDEELKARYQMAGIVHIVAISGLHISILGMGLFRLMKRLGTGILAAAFVSLTVMLLYGIMTGGSVSTMRAVCMFLLSMGAKVLGRIYDMPTALALSAVLILMESPAYLYQSSFLLSFGAVLGVGVAAPAVEAFLGMKHPAAKMLLSSACVQLVTLPVMLYFFGEVSVAGVVLNLAVLPTVGVVLASGTAAIFGGLVSPVLGAALILPGRGILMLYEWLCAAAGRLPLCTWIGGQPKAWQIAGFYGVFLLTLLFMKKSILREKRSLLSRGCAMAAFVLAIFLLGFRREEGLRITFLDVGQGDGIVVETDGGGCFLIDGGSQNKSGLARYQLLPFLKSRGIGYLDAVFLSHTDADHISGVQELLEEIVRGTTAVRVGALVLPAWSQPPEIYGELCSLAEKAGARVQTVSAGAGLQSGQTEMKVLWPKKDARGEDVNEESMVTELTCQGFSFLFTGDIGEPTEKKLLAEGALEDVQVLKVGHHGSRYSTSGAFLEATRPEIAVISVSATNTYGHPGADTLSRLEEAGARVWCTRDCGAVTVRVRDKELLLETFLGE